MITIEKANSMMFNLNYYVHRHRCAIVNKYYAQVFNKIKIITVSMKYLMEYKNIKHPHYNHRCV